MPKRKTILDLLDNLAPDVQRAFLESIDRITGSVQIRALERAIEARDLNQVLRVLELGPEFFAPLDRALAASYQAGGDWAMGQLVADSVRQGARVTAFFDARNYRAERWLQDSSSKLITRILDDARDNIRSALTAGAEAGEGARSTALRIVGRVNRTTGTRQGGIIGLTADQEKWTRNAYAELLSGDRAYFGRKLRDRRFDAVLAKAIREGRGVTSSEARAMVARYSDRLLKLRGDTIARNELQESLHAAQDEGLQQLVDSGKVSSDQIEEEWDAANDMDTRPSHAAMDGQRRRHGEAFTTGQGYQLRYPRDGSLGAPADELINCRCRKKIRIDWIKGLSR